MRQVLAAFALSAFTLGLFAAPVPKEKEKVKDEDAIQGTWQVESFDMGGAPGGPPPGEIAKLKLTFKDGKVTANRGDGSKEDAIDYKLDAKTKPKSIDLTEGGRPMLGIYELDGDTLKICMSEGGQQGVRPEELKSDGKNIAVITLKRVKEEKKEEKKDK
jgi:uncharacterized protein (TIGR03067 family)